MANHARLGPSNHRWPHCPGSLREEENYPHEERGSNPASIDGTHSHTLLELCLNSGSKAQRYKELELEDHDGKFVVHQDRIDRVQKALDYVNSRVEQLKKTYSEVHVYAEEKADPGTFFGRDDWWGTADITIVAHGSSIAPYIEIADLKDGNGWVSEVDNSQLIAYAFGQSIKHLGNVFSIPKKTQVVMTIIQPKREPVVRPYEITFAELFAKASQLAKAAALTDNPEAKLDAGEWCQWCRHKPNCTERQKQALVEMPQHVIFKMIEEAFGDLESLDEQGLVSLYNAKQGILDIFSKVDTIMEERLKQGQRIEGFAMRPSRSTRKFRDDALEKIKRKYKLTRKDLYKEVAVSPAQLEKCEKLTPEQLAEINTEFVEVQAGKPTLSRIEQPSMTEIFGDYKWDQ